MVLSFSGMLIIRARATSPPLRMASATSPDLPRPTPTLPCLSPTTTSALKLNRRPPFTTLEERLMKTTFSESSLMGLPSAVKNSVLPSPGRFVLRGPRPCPGPPLPALPPPGLKFPATVFFSYLKLKLQTRLAGCVSKCFNLAMVFCSVAIEHNLLDAFTDSGLGSDCPELFGALDIGFELVTIS